MLALIVLQAIALCHAQQQKVYPLLMAAKNKIKLEQGNARYFELTKVQSTLPLVFTAFPEGGQPVGSFKIYLSNQADDKLPPSSLCVLSQSFQHCVFRAELLTLHSGQSTYITAKCLSGPCTLNLNVAQPAVNSFSSFGKSQVQFANSEVSLLQFQWPSKFIFTSDQNNRVMLDINFVQPRNLQKISKLNAQVIGCQPFRSEIIGDRILLAFAPVISADRSQASACKEGQTVTVVVMGKPEHSASVDFYSYRMIEDITINQQYVDIIKANGKNEYKLLYQPSQAYDYIKFAVKFAKRITTPMMVFINSDDRPDLSQNYYWNAIFNPTIDESSKDASQVQGKEYNLIITKSQLVSIGAEGIRFYIQLFAEEEGVFNFEVESETFEQYMIDFSADEILSGKVELSQVINFVFLYPNSEHDVKLLFNLQQGNATIQLRQCPKNLCDDIYEKDYKDVAVISQASASVKEIVFRPTCQSKSFCQYLITVVGASELPCIFQMEQVSLAPEVMHIPLSDGDPVLNTIKWSEYQFYVFDTQVYSEWKTLQVSVSSPYVVFYTSHNDLCKYPMPEECADSLGLMGVQDSPVVYESGELSRMVYISVYGYRHTKYQIMITLQYGSEESQIIMLQNGIPIQGELTPSTAADYYMFLIPNNTLEDIEINLTGPKDKILLLAGNLADPPTPARYQWMSNSNFLLVNHTQKDFAKSHKLWVVVMAGEHGFSHAPKKGADNARASDGILYYSLTVSTSAFVKTMEIGEPMFDVVQALDVQTYQFQIVPKQETISINRNIFGDAEDTERIVFYLGRTPAKAPADWQYRLKGSEQATFMLNTSVIGNLCPSQLKAGADESTCNLFMGIQNFGLKKVSYTLTVWELEQAVEITEGLQHTYTLYHINDYMYFYYIPTHRDSTINLYMYSHYGQLNYLVSIYKLEPGVPMTKWPFPKSGQQNHDYTSGIFNSHSITLEAKALDECWPAGQPNQCRVLISVSFFELDVYDLAQQAQFDDDFSIVISTSYSEIFPGQRMEFSLKYQESRYFFIDLKNALDTRRSINVQLTQLLGRALLCGSIRDTKKNRFPKSYLAADFITNGNFMEISYQQIKQIMKENSLSINQSPQLILEVYSLDGTGQFILTYTDSSLGIIELLHGIPQEFVLKPRQRMAFQYFNYFNSTFQIKVTRAYGFGDLKVTVCDTEKEIEQCTKLDVDIELHMAGSESTQVHVYNSNENLFCFYCYYLIELAAEESEMHGFVNVLLDEDAAWLMEGVQFVDFLNAGQVNYYRLSVPTNEETEIQLTALVGAPAVYVNYYYELDYTKYKDGPFQTSAADSYLNIKIPSRNDMMMADDKFKPYNRPIADQSLQAPGAYNASDEDLSDYFIQTEIFIAVVNERTATNSNGMNYSITYMAGELERLIIDGHIVHSVLEAKERTTLIYQHFDLSAPAILSVEIQTQNFPAGMLLLAATLRAQSSKLNVSNVDQTPEEIQLKVLSVRDSTAIYALPERQGAYQIIFKNNGKSQVTFNAYINTRDMTLVPFNEKIEHVLVPDSVNYYEFIAPSKGYVALYMTHCAGPMQMGWSQNYEQFINKEYQFYTESIAGHTYIDPIQVKKGPLYIALTSGNQNAFYSVKGNFYLKESEVPHVKLDYGGEGILKYTREQDNVVSVSFKPLICHNCTRAEMKGAQVSYRVIWSKDAGLLNVIGKCGNQNYMGTSKSSDPKMIQESKVQIQDIVNLNKVKVANINLDLNQDHDIQQKLYFERAESPYYVSVVARVTNFGKSKQEVMIFYENIEIRPLQKFYQRFSVSNFLFVVSYILLVLFFVTGLVLILRRYYRNKMGNVARIYHSAEPQDFSQNIEVEKTEFNAQSLNAGTPLSNLQQPQQPVDSAAQKKAQKQGYNQLEEAI